MKHTFVHTTAKIIVLMLLFGVSHLACSQQTPSTTSTLSIGFGIVGGSLVGEASRYGGFGGGGLVFVEYPMSEKLSLDATVSFVSFMPVSETNSVEESKMTTLPYIAGFRFYPTAYHTGIYLGGGIGGAQVRALQRVVRPMAGAHDSSDEFHALALVPRLGYAAGKFDIQANLVLLKDALYDANTFNVLFAYRLN